MNWDVWTEVERILDSHHIKPIVAVVAETRDASLNVGNHRADFWSIVRRWQETGWTIGLHGFQHVYSTDDAGIVGINRRSEFAGLSHDEQHAKLRAAVQKFHDERVRVDLWVAPGHSFDATTLKILRDLNIGVVSDGFYFRVIEKEECIWLPQQLWRFRDLPFGVWTVCFHTNDWKTLELERFRNAIAKYAERIATCDEIVRRRHSRVTILDEMAARLYRKLVIGKRGLRVANR